MSRLSLSAVLGIGLVLTACGPVRADDLLDKVAAQRDTTDIKNRLAEARKLAATNPAKANESLKVAEFLLSDSKTLSASERAEFAQQIAQIRRQAQAGTREQDEQARAEAERAALKQQQEARQREQDARSGSKGTVGQAKDFIKTGNSALSSSKELKLKGEQGFLETGRGVMDAASRKVEERFTKRWLWVLEHGKTGIKISPEEKELAKMLNLTLSVDFKNHTLKQVIEYLQDKTGGKLPIFIDELSLKEAEVDYDAQVTFSAKKATMRTVLKQVLGGKGLTFVIKQAAIHVMTPAKAKEQIVTRTYPIADLLGTADPRFGPIMNQQQQLIAAQQLMQIIINQVEPTSWQVNGGTGTIAFVQQSMALVIRNTAEWHYQMNGLIGY